jgi:hypothetical protein
MNDNEIRRLAHAIDALRPDWPISSLTTFIRKNMAGWSYRDAAVALVYVACDTKTDGQHASDTPRRVLEQGPWRVAAAVGGSTAMRTHAPKRHEECATHPGHWAHNCGGCRAEAFDVDAPVSPDLPPVSVVNPRLAQRLTTRGGTA